MLNILEQIFFRITGIDKKREEIQSINRMLRIETLRVKEKQRKIEEMYKGEITRDIIRAMGAQL